MRCAVCLYIKDHNPDADPQVAVYEAITTVSGTAVCKGHVLSMTQGWGWIADKVHRGKEVAARGEE